MKIYLGFVSYSSARYGPNCMIRKKSIYNVQIRKSETQSIYTQTAMPSIFMQLQKQFKKLQSYFCFVCLNGIAKSKIRKLIPYFFSNSNHYGFLQKLNSFFGCGGKQWFSFCFSSINI